MESYFVIFGEDNEAFKINLNRPDEVSALQQMPTAANPYMAAAVYGSSIFVTVAGENSDEIWKFDSKYSEWKKCASLVIKRASRSVAFVDHILYICGGRLYTKPDTFDDVEAFDTIDNKCKTVGKLAYSVICARHCVSYKASLYIFGGLNACNQAVDTVQVYDTKSNSCSVLTNPMPRKGRDLHAVMFENYVILLGEGYCLVYDFDTDTWKVRDQFKTDVVHFGLTVHHEKLFVTKSLEPSYSGADDVRYVPVVNILNDELIEWMHHTKLPQHLHVYTSGKLEIFA